MRQRVGEKKTRAIRKKTGLPVVKVYVRGGTDHRKDLHLEDGAVVHLYKDGSMKIAVRPPPELTRATFPPKSGLLRI